MEVHSHTHTPGKKGTHYFREYFTILCMLALIIGINK